MKTMRYAVLIVLMVGLLATDSHSGQARRRISSLTYPSFDTEDIQAEIKFGQDLGARILANYPLWDNETANRYVSLVGRSLAIFSARGELSFTFGVLDSQEVNAFATPGGFVFVTRGALIRMADEAQLAAVLGHEMAHVTQRHMVNELKIKGDHGSAMGGLASLIGGAAGGVRSGIEIGLTFGTEILFNRGYLLKDEMEADRVGLLITACAGYDPTALKRFLISVERFETEPQTPSKNHPVLAQRLSQIDRILNENGLAALNRPKLKERFNEMVVRP